jgi:hypothetical protein
VSQSICNSSHPPCIQPQEIPRKDVGSITIKIKNGGLESMLHRGGRKGEIHVTVMQRLTILNVFKHMHDTSFFASIQQVHKISFSLVTSKQ